MQLALIVGHNLFDRIMSHFNALFGAILFLVFFTFIEQMALLSDQHDMFEREIDGDEPDSDDGDEYVDEYRQTPHRGSAPYEHLPLFASDDDIYEREYGFDHGFGDDVRLVDEDERRQTVDLLLDEPGYGNDENDDEDDENEKDEEVRDRRQVEPVLYAGQRAGRIHRMTPNNQNRDGLEEDEEDDEADEDLRLSHSDPREFDFDFGPQESRIVATQNLSNDDKNGTTTTTTNGIGPVQQKRLYQEQKSTPTADKLVTVQEGNSKQGNFRWRIVATVDRPKNRPSQSITTTTATFESIGSN